MQLFTLPSAILVVAFGVVGVHSATDFSVTTSGNYVWNQTGLSLTTTRYTPGQFQARMPFSTGYFGASLAALGPFFEVDVNQTDANGIQPSNGWPLFDTRISFSTVSGFYDIQPNGTGTNYPWLNQYGWESFISGIPHATAINFEFGDAWLDSTVSNETISDFSSKITFSTGVGEWNFNWVPGGSSASYNVSYTVFFSRVRPNVAAVRATIIPSVSISGTVTDLLNGASAVRSYLNDKGVDANSSTIYSSVHPNGLANKLAYVVSGVNFTNAYTDLSSRVQASASVVGDNSTTIGQTYNISLEAGEPATFYKYIGVASNDKFSDPETTARQAQKAAQNDGWDVLMAEHVAAWAKIMTGDKVDNFTDPVTGQLPDSQDIEILQIAAVANTYYLTQELRPAGEGLNDNSVAVGGLTSDSYAGLIFWDADYWMAPGLNLAYPSLAKQIPNFRVKQHPQALENAAFNDYPNGTAIYSWTAGRYGNCTGTGPCVDYEYHLNYDIAFNMFQLLNITNNVTWFEDGPQQVIQSAAEMTSHLLQYNETTETYWIHNMTDPDEYANNVDNGAFTIASAARLLEVVNAMSAANGLAVNSTWETQWQDIEFPTASSNITLEYQMMNNNVAVKQADVVLLTYPLDYEQDYTTADRILDLDYYANKQSANGPAMTYSVFAVDANALSLSGCSAYTYTLNGILPYLRAPWFQFSEQAVDNYDLNGGTNPAFPFLTGHGGANQIVPFGLLGVRTDQTMLYIDPSLPPQIPYVRVRTFHYAGATFTASMNNTHTNFTRLSTPPSSGLVDAYADTSLPFAVGSPGSTTTNTVGEIAINQTITIPNRLYWQNLTTGGNILQCMPVSSDSTYAAGQFPTAAIDGATATRWQPATNETATFTVDLSSRPYFKVDSLEFDWGARPPLRATVYFGNLTNGVMVSTSEVKVDLEGIAPSLPYDEITAQASSEMVEPVTSNTTSLTVEGVWSGAYARLEVEGCWEDDGVGAMVGEFVVVSNDLGDVVS